MWRHLWAAPNTALGLALGGLGCLAGGHVRWIDGTWEIHGRLLGWCLRHATPLPGGASAITFGHVVLGQDAATLAACRAHERVHVRQYERWGPFFLPVYLGASVLAWLRGGAAYRDNRFERQARLESGESA